MYELPWASTITEYAVSEFRVIEKCGEMLTGAASALIVVAVKKWL
jgi:hypothetical protein